MYLSDVFKKNVSYRISTNQTMGDSKDAVVAYIEKDSILHL